MQTENQSCILLVEDEPEVLRINERLLRRHGYRVRTAATCARCLVVLEEEIPDLLILDIMLPDGSGFDLCRRFREISDHPVIFLTGKNQVSDKVDGLGMGADYYLTKPCDLDELLAVTDRLIRRHLQQKTRTRITRGSLALDIPRGKALVDGRDTGLTAKEFALLLALVRNEDREISPHALYETVWGMPSAEDVRTVRTHIKNLRRKLGADDARDFDIVSAYGKGYTFTTFR